MKRKILVADRDSSLKDIFRVTFTDEKYLILYAPTARDVERVAADEKPDVYIVNVSLQKGSGIEVYEKLQSQGLLRQARFFFLKNEDDATELLGYDVEGVIEKPINFFKLHEKVDRDDDILELTEVVEEPGDVVARRKAILEQELKKAAARIEPAPAAPGVTPQQGSPPEKTAAERRPAEAGAPVEPREQDWLETVGERITSRAAPAATTEEVVNLKAELSAVLARSLEGTAQRLSAELAEVMGRYIEQYTRQTLYEVAERVIREEIDKLLKESSG